MNRFLKTEDTVSVCNRDNCIHASGDNGKLIVAGVFFLLVCAGIAKLAN